VEKYRSHSCSVLCNKSISTSYLSDEEQGLYGNFLGTFDFFFFSILCVLAIITLGFYVL